jgi:hypothetical protein
MLRRRAAQVAKSHVAEQSAAAPSALRPGMAVAMTPVMFDQLRISQVTELFPAPQVQMSLS